MLIEQRLHIPRSLGTRIDATQFKPLYSPESLRKRLAESTNGD